MVPLPFNRATNPQGESIGRNIPAKRALSAVIVKERIRFVDTPRLGRFRLGGIKNLPLWRVLQGKKSKLVVKNRSWLPKWQKFAIYEGEKNPMCAQKSLSFWINRVTQRRIAGKATAAPAFNPPQMCCPWSRSPRDRLPLCAWCVPGHAARLFRRGPIRQVNRRPASQKGTAACAPSVPGSAVTGCPPAVRASMAGRSPPAGCPCPPPCPPPVAPPVARRFFPGPAPRGAAAA